MSTVGLISQVTVDLTLTEFTEVIDAFHDIHIAFHESFLDALGH